MKKKQNNGNPAAGNGNGAMSVMYISTFPPRVCGIATFTQDLTHAMDDMMSPVVSSKIIAMNPGGVFSFRYPRKVVFQINQEREEEYLNAARLINESDAIKLVNIQHEFGIFGGERGSLLLPFMEAIKKPKVITFHTVLPKPNDLYLKITTALAEQSNAVIVMTGTSKKILTEQYTIPQRKIKVIPHGIHLQQYSTSIQAKRSIGYSDKVVLATFGLLGRGKGLEYVIDALPRVKEQYPDFVYLILGATHPGVVMHEGESYRNTLLQKVYELGLCDHVKFYNRYFPLSELLHFLRATDIYISTSLSPNQAVSGTLSYALGMGRPVISTAFSQATEIIHDDVGILVDFMNPPAYSEAILALLEDEERRLQMGRNAYFRTRNMTWPNVALRYIKVFAQYAPGLAKVSDQKSIPKIKLDHLIHLTDDFGIIQFARLNRRDVTSGYTLDDNAQALSVAVQYYKKLGGSGRSVSDVQQKNKLLRLISVYLNFINSVVDENGCYQNYVKHDRIPDDELNKNGNHQEASARAIYALALTSTTASLPKSIRQSAHGILSRTVRYALVFDSPRAIALFIKALCVLCANKVSIKEIDIPKLLRSRSDRLVELYMSVSSEQWQWFEKSLTYSNGVLPEALLMAYQKTADARYLEIGLKALDFLISESFMNDVLMPIGQSGWREQKRRRYTYDQQPEEAKSIVYALNAAYRVTKNEEYYRLMYRAFLWFLGDNTLNQVVYDRTTGGCYDGVGRVAINLNQGAESTISYLLARLILD